MSNMNSPAYDAFSVQEYQHTLSTKLDGERMCMVKCGFMWFYCRCLTNYSIVCWIVDSIVTPVSKSVLGPVVDVDVILGFDPTLIDVLCDGDMNLSPHTRKVEWIKDRMEELTRVYLFLSNIHCRPLFSILWDAREYSLTVVYPIDGLMAMSLGNTA